MSDQHDAQSIEDLYPPIMARPVPFPLPPAFLHQLGYERAVAALDSVAVDDDRARRTRNGMADAIGAVWLEFGSRRIKHEAVSS